MRLLTCAGLACVLVAGCVGPRPLTLKHYGRNVILRADSTLWVEDERVGIAKLQEALLRHMTTDTMPLTLHVHERTSPRAYDVVVDALRKAGYRNITFAVFRD